VIRWAVRRLLQAGVTFVASLLVLFAVMRLTPGDPLARLEADRQVTPDERAALRRRYGLDQPAGRQLAVYLSGLARGDLGVSIGHYPERVTTLLRTRLPASLLLGGAVLLLNFTLGVWLGVVQARHRGRPLDRWLTGLSLAGYSMPSFWLALILVSLVSLRWQLLPAAQMQDPFLPPGAGTPAMVLDLLRHLILPVVTLSTVTIAATMRHQRDAMIRVLRLDFVRAARARGLGERRVIWKHAWPNAVFPVLTLFGLWLPLLVTGSVFVEAVFNWPGLGSLAADAVATRDYPLLMGISMLASGMIIVGGVVTDLGHLMLDPRVRDQ
jgi:ABC-type dipeptide/oligopeptide/nickel transport system permease component